MIKEVEAEDVLDCLEDLNKNLRELTAVTKAAHDKKLDVTVTAPDVKVAPANVTVDSPVTVHVPEPKHRSYLIQDVKRDDKGLLTSFRIVVEG